MRDQLGDDGLGLVHRNGESEVTAEQHATGIDSDDLALEVDQRSTGISWRDRCIMLDPRVVAASRRILVETIFIIGLVFEQRHQQTPWIVDDAGTQ